MTMNVRLIKAGNIGTSKASWKNNAAAQKSYFDSLPGRSFSCLTVPLGEPLQLKASASELLGYSYGFLSYDGNIRYYFVIGDIEFSDSQMAKVHYTVDAWETALYQYGLSIRKLSASRISGTYGEYGTIGLPNHNAYRPYEPCFWENSRNDKTTIVCWVALCWISSENRYRTYWVDHNALTSLNTAMDLAHGGWVSAVGITGSDVLNACFCYGDSDYELGKLSDWQSLSVESGEAHYTMRYVDMERPATMTILSREYANLKGVATVSSVDSEFRVCDLRGNCVYKAQYSEVLEFTSGQIVLTPSSISTVLIFRTMSTGDLVNVTIPAEQCSVITDSWAEYNYRQRAIDCQSRNMQMNQQLVSGIAGVAMTAVTGGVGGAVAKAMGSAAMSASKGAAAGFGAGLISSLGTYAISSYYAPKEQAITDKSYQLAGDNVSVYGGISGNLIYRLYNNNCFTGKYCFDPRSKAMYESDIATNGYYVQGVMADVGREYLAGRYVVGQVEIEASIPASWKEQIESRFERGVEFI